jgi:hypothetical protein
MLSSNMKHGTELTSPCYMETHCEHQAVQQSVHYSWESGQELRMTGNTVCGTYVKNGQ